MLSLNYSGKGQNATNFCAKLSVFYKIMTVLTDRRVHGS